MEFELSILFTLKKSKVGTNGQIPVYLRITVNGERVEVSTNRKIEVSRWDADIQRAKGRSESARVFNNHLDNLENQVKRDYNSLREKSEAVSAVVLRDMLTGKNAKRYYLLNVFEINNKLVEQEEGGKYSRSTR